MKILFFSPYFYPYTSGLTEYPRRVLRELAKTHDVTVLTFPHSRKLPPEEKFEGMKIIRMPYLFRASKGFISPQSWWHFTIEARRADCIILNLPSVEGLPLAILGAILRKRTIAFFYCFIYLGPSLSHRLLSSIVNAVTFLQCALSHKIVGLPDYVEHTPLHRYYAHKIVSIPPPVQEMPTDSVYFKKLLAQKAGRMWVGFVGRIAREKGLEYLIEAYPAIQKKHEVELVFAGPQDSVGENEYAQKIRNLLLERHIPHRFLGFLEEEELGAFYKAIDVLVLPSVNRTEAFGMVQVEAMLAGTPVVASDLPGVRYPIQRTGMGLLVAPKSAPALGAAVSKTVQNLERFASVQKMRRAREIFVKGQSLASLERLLRS